MDLKITVDLDLKSLDHTKKLEEITPNQLGEL